MTPKEIKRVRKDLGWTQARMGRYLCVDPSTLRRWESEGTKTSYPAPRLVERLLKLTRVISKGSLNKLLDEPLIEEKICCNQQKTPNVNFKK